GVSRFGAVAEVSAFHEDRWVMGVAEDPEVGRMHAAIDRSRKRGQILLNCSRQSEGVWRMVISFDAFHSATARVVEVNANEDGVLLFVAERDPVIEWNESVVGASENGPELRLAEFAVDPQGDIKRGGFFGRRIPPGGPAVLATVAGIHDDGFESVTGVRGDGRAAAETKSGPERKDSDK